jgi:hypothetical protein
MMVGGVSNIPFVVPEDSSRAKSSVVGKSYCQLVPYRATDLHHKDLHPMSGQQGRLSDGECQEMIG